MAKCKTSLMRDTYSDDVASAIFSNLNASLKRREELSIWGPLIMPHRKKFDIPYESEQNKATKNTLKSENEFSARMTEETKFRENNYSTPKQSDVATSLKVPKRLDSDVLGKPTILNEERTWRTKSPLPCFQTSDEENVPPKKQNFEDTEDCGQLHRKIPKIMNNKMLGETRIVYGSEYNSAYCHDSSIDAENSVITEESFADCTSLYEDYKTTHQLHDKKGIGSSRKIDMVKQNDIESQNSNATYASNTKSAEVESSAFQDWCSKRRENFNSKEKSGLRKFPKVFNMRDFCKTNMQDNCSASSVYCRDMPDDAGNTDTEEQVIKSTKSNYQENDESAIKDYKKTAMSECEYVSSKTPDGELVYVTKKYGITESEFQDWFKRMREESVTKDNLNQSTTQASRLINVTDKNRSTNKKKELSNKKSNNSNPKHLKKVGWSDDARNTDTEEQVIKSTKSSYQVYDECAIKDYKKTTAMSECKFLSSKIPDEGQVSVTKVTEGMRETKFQDWCNRRSKESVTKHNRNQSITQSSRLMNITDTDRSTNKKKDRSNTKSNNSNPKHMKKVKRSVSNQISKVKNLPDCSYSENNGSYASKDKTLLCVKITDEKGDKSHEFMADTSTIGGLKRKFPKLSAVLPDIDSGCKKLDYGIDTMNIILRYVISRSYSLDVMPTPMIGVEVLSATELYEICELHNIFKEDFLQNVLTPNNVNSVFSYASYFNLKEVCDVCKSIVPDIALNPHVPKRRQKICFLSISTYIEPQEICFPFNPIENVINNSFDRHIRNKLTFKAISDCYVITGFKIQLNKEHLKSNWEDTNMLKIDYCTKYVIDNKEVETRREEKPLRPTMTVYFKKELEVNRNSVVEITVETDIKPYLCSAHEGKKIKYPGEFNLLIESEAKFLCSDMKVFIIGKLLYHVKKHQ